MKTVLVTGATGAIGKAIARNIAFNLDNHVIMVIRSESKGKNVLDEIVNITNNPNIEFAVIDLSDKAEIFEFSKNLETPVDVLVNNAATPPRQRLETDCGIELQWATNVLGYYWMISAFSPAFSETLQGIAINSCHPGDVNSALSNDLGFGGHQSPDEGARTPVWLAMENAGIENTGKYFEHGRESTCQFSGNKAEIRQLMDICGKY